MPLGFRQEAFTLGAFASQFPRPADGFEPVAAAGVPGVVWPYEEFHCLLIGDAPRERLLLISRAVQAELDGDGAEPG